MTCDPRCSCYVAECRCGGCAAVANLASESICLVAPDEDRLTMEKRSCCRRWGSLLNGRPPPIAPAEQTLSTKTRPMLAQLRTGYRRILSQYMQRIDPTACKHCHDRGHSPHDAHHLFDYLSKPTTLTVESLWTAPTVST